MLRARRAAQVLAASILIWIAATLLVAAQLLLAYLSDPSSHAAEDATLGMVLLSPQLLVALAGVGALLALRASSPTAPWLGLAWGILQLTVGLVISARPLTLLVSVVTEGRRVSWDAGETAIVFTMDSLADFTHWTDWVGVALLLVAIVGTAAAAALLVVPARRAGR